jgi:hypothetical protein
MEPRKETRCRQETRCTDCGPRQFSPVPKRVMDGSEPGEVVAAAVLSGAPTDLEARTVRYITVG